ncbi:hypothetical protein ACLOJK_011354 [Asimina triloba]
MRPVKRKFPPVAFRKSSFEGQANINLGGKHFSICIQTLQNIISVESFFGSEIERRGLGYKNKYHFSTVDEYRIAQAEVELPLGGELDWRDGSRDDIQPIERQESPPNLVGLRLRFEGFRQQRRSNGIERRSERKDVRDAPPRQAAEKILAVVRLHLSESSQGTKRRSGNERRGKVLFVWKIRSSPPTPRPSVSSQRSQGTGSFEIK